MTRVDDAVERRETGNDLAQFSPINKDHARQMKGRPETLQAQVKTGLTPKEKARRVGAVSHAHVWSRRQDPRAIRQALESPA